MTIEQLTLFLGWNLLINLILFALASIGILLFRERIAAGIRDRFCDPQLQSLGEFWVPSTSSPGGGESAISHVGSL